MEVAVVLLKWGYFYFIFILSLSLMLQTLTQVPMREKNKHFKHTGIHKKMLQDE